MPGLARSPSGLALAAPPPKLGALVTQLAAERADRLLVEETAPKSLLDPQQKHLFMPDSSRGSGHVQMDCILSLVFIGSSCLFLLICKIM